VREGALLPLAVPRQRTDLSAGIDIVPTLYGDSVACGMLWEDDGCSRDARGRWLRLEWTAEKGFSVAGSDRQEISSYRFRPATTPDRSELRDGLQ